MSMSRELTNSTLCLNFHLDISFQLFMLTLIISNPAWFRKKIPLLMVSETSNLLLTVLDTQLGIRSHFAPAPACSVRYRLMYLFSSAERNSMEQGRKVSEHAIPLARNFSCLGKDVESGNIAQVRINLAALQSFFSDCVTVNLYRALQLSEAFFSAEFELKF